MEVAVADAADADAVADLWVALAADQIAHGSHILPGENRATIRESVDHHLVADELLVARRDGVVVGFVMFTVENGRFEQDADRGIVENIYVTPAHRGRGVGSELLAAAERTLEDRGVDVVALDVMADNEAARRFYRRHGYEPHRVQMEKATESDTL
ncbi:GNAT family N-acetyltransferase [Halomicrobium salinisoli]|uniref:GNAT family N-acetyltransferase n=1 Tax=Halomicrobium salinisoli TaxID=2878391 RepID=UPI001CF07B5F|nr:GNAT family N-acetyltransferase [Halomicrobium salinisoli]